MKFGVWSAECGVKEWNPSIHSAFRIPHSALVVVVLLFVSANILAVDRLLDPTEPPVGLFKSEEGEVVAPAPRWVVNSVLVSPKRKIAIINNKIVMPGESLDGQKIVDIRLEGVVLEGKGGEELLLLPGREVKTGYRRQDSGVRE